ncbi:hypothetical protein CANCADRAFT_64289 [Tortispora caseinolytica NRRL Y-17796]|uniref:CBS domain-containing protein n=1 Tax=Tortispora caseinolytica NRRL Y-17796 TaxID=767744 RepID=A0A1E4TEC6_9ASCO|nr:hypothetical protein CANCADRAFT_64289 [Tortispora caseinolytica NRRL Y-17796]
MNSPAPGSDAGSNLTESRKKQSRRDDQLRRKLESDISKKRIQGSPFVRKHTRSRREYAPGTVMALKPTAALQIKGTTTAAAAAQLMAAHRENCVLVTGSDDRISGIFTAKDLAFRVIGKGLNPSKVAVDSIMTSNPLCVRANTSATEALDLMVSRGFRHLPVMDEASDIVGILDITKCFYEAMEKLDKAFASSKKLYDALEGMQSELGTSHPVQIFQYADALRRKMAGPSLDSVLDGTAPVSINVKSSVYDAAQLMIENHTTCVLVTDKDSITGIFTTKDIVLRVIAAGLDANLCSVVRVMTPHPDFAPQTMNIQEALRKMHTGHYLNLPVTGEDGEVVGVVDVLKLTYATLEQIHTMNGDSEGPAWDKFWNSFEQDSESGVSDSNHLVSPSKLSMHDTEDFLTPGDSVSHGDFAISQVDNNELFSFKFKSPGGRVHRFKAAPSAGLESFLALILEKLTKSEVETLGGAGVFADGKLVTAGFAVSYIDDDGDPVSITSDYDLQDAVKFSMQRHQDKVELYVHHPDEAQDMHAPTPPGSASPIASPNISTPTRSKDHKRNSWRESWFSDNNPKVIKVKEDLIPGVPNDLLLPGALVTLAASILIVFTVSKK